MATNEYSLQKQRLEALRESLQSQELQRLAISREQRILSNIQNRDSSLVQAALFRSQMQAQMEASRGVFRSAIGGIFSSPFSRNPGVSLPTSLVYGQPFSGLISDAGVGQFVNAASFGLFRPDYAYSVAQSRAQVTQSARDELSLRIGSDLSSNLKSLVPGFFAQRFGIAYSGDEPRLRRDVTANLAFMRDIGQGSYGMNISGRGMRSTSDFVDRYTKGITNIKRGIAKDSGFGLTRAEIGALTDTASDMVMNDTRLVSRAVSNRDPGSLVSEQDKVTRALVELTRALNSSVSQTQKLTTEMRQAGLSTRDMAKLVNVTTQMRSQSAQMGMNESDLLKYVLPAVAQGREAGFSATSIAAARIGSVQNLLSRYNRGDMSREDLYRFGGGSDTEAAMLRAQFQSGLGSNFISRTGGMFGALSANGLSGNNIFQASSNIGRLMLSDPTSSLAASQSASTQLLASDTAIVDAFGLARSSAAVSPLNSDQRRRVAIQRYQSLLGMDSPVRAAQEYAIYERSLNRLKASYGFSDNQALGFMKAGDIAIKSGAPLLDEASRAKSFLSETDTILQAASGVDVGGYYSSLGISRKNINQTRKTLIELGMSSAEVDAYIANVSTVGGGFRDSSGRQTPLRELGAIFGSSAPTIGQFKKAFGGYTEDQQMLNALDKVMFATERSANPALGSKTEEIKRLLTDQSSTSSSVSALVSGPEIARLQQLMIMTSQRAPINGRLDGQSQGGAIWVRMTKDEQ